MYPQMMKQSGAPLVGKLQQYINEGYFSLVDDLTPPMIDQNMPSIIPKKILLFWHDKTPPHDVNASIEKIKLHNTEFDIQLFDAEMAYDYIHDHYGNRLSDLYRRRCLHRAMQADFFRICYLLREGGLYIDVDIDCFQSIDHICNHQDFGCFLLYTEGPPFCIDNDFIACEPNSFVIAAILERIEIHLTLKQSFSNVWEYTGPGVVTMAIMSILIQEIEKTGSNSILRHHLKLGARGLTTRVYHPADFEYKRTVEGDWRQFTLPSDLCNL